MSNKRPSESHTEIDNAEPNKKAPKGDVCLDIELDAEQLTDNPPDKAYMSHRDNSYDISDSVNEDIPVSLSNTDIEDVFDSDGVLEPSAAKKLTGDYDEPIILIITKKTRDLFINTFKDLHSQDKTNKTGISRDMSTQTDNINVSDTDTLAHSIPHHTDATTDTSVHPTECDTDLAHKTSSNFYSLFNILEYKSRSIPATALRENLDTREEFDLFRHIRKELTNYLVAGSKTINMIRNFNSGNTHYMLPVKGHIVPNRLDKDYVFSVQDKLNKITTNLNADIFNKTLQQCQRTVDIASDIQENYSTKLVAKAWRAVRRSHTDFRQYTFALNPPVSQQHERHVHTEATHRDRNTTRQENTHRVTVDTRHRQRDTPAPPRDSNSIYTWRQHDPDRFKEHETSYPHTTRQEYYRSDRDNRFHEKNFPPLRRSSGAYNTDPYLNASRRP